MDEVASFWLHGAGVGAMDGNAFGGMVGMCE